MTEQTNLEDKIRDLLNSEGSAEDKIQSIYEALLPDSPLPDPLFLAKATHPDHGEGIVTSHRPDGDGVVRFISPDERYGDGTSHRWVSPDILTFHTPDMSKNAAKIDTSTEHVDPIDTTPDHPEFLETEEDYRSAPEGTIVLVDALPGEGAWTKTAPGEWAGTPSFMVWCDRYMGAVPSRVIRWGRGDS